MEEVNDESSYSGGLTSGSNTAQTADTRRRLYSGSFFGMFNKQKKMKKQKIEKLNKKLIAVLSSEQRLWRILKLKQIFLGNFMRRKAIRQKLLDSVYLYQLQNSVVAPI